MKLFTLIFLFSTSAFASDLQGYWAKYQMIAEFETGEIQKSYQIKELLRADESKNEYVIKRTDINSDGTIDEEEEIEDDFISPEKGEIIVMNCTSAGGTISTLPFGNTVLNTCILENSIVLAGVPFGLAAAEWEMEIVLPGGQTTTVKISSTLVEFGKKNSKL